MGLNFKVRNNTELLEENALCAKGTIPITRTHLSIHHRAGQVPTNKTELRVVPSNHEYTQVSVESGPYFGAHAKFSVWNPSVTNAKEFSTAQLWVVAGQGDDINIIEAGWNVIAGVDKPTTFIYWTRDFYKNTGCHNLQCPGFVQTSNKIALGSFLSPISTYNGDQYHVDITVYKDKQSGNWWLRIQGEDVGYWPPSIFSSLAESSTSIHWGGEIANLRLGGHHTSTQMGNGHFPAEGFRKAGLIFDLKYVDNNGIFQDPDVVIPYVTQPFCYDMLLGRKGDNGFGVHVYYGGPGFSDQCP